MNNCFLCGLYKYSNFPMIEGKGNTNNPKIIMIGEAPGPDESKKGEVFIGRAGRKLDQMIKPYKDDIYITNMVKCFPPISTENPMKGFRVPKDSEIQYCKSFLEEEIYSFNKSNPIIITLGNIALKGLIGEHRGITKELGQSRIIELSEKYDYEQFPLTPNYHPSYILRNPDKEKDFIKVLESVYEYY